MKKVFAILLALAMLLALPISANATSSSYSSEENSSSWNSSGMSSSSSVADRHPTIPATIGEESTLFVRVYTLVQDGEDEDLDFIDSFNVPVAEDLAYTELVLPHGTDLSKLYFRIQLHDVDFQADETDLIAADRTLNDWVYHSWYLSSYGEDRLQYSIGGDYVDYEPDYRSCKSVDQNGLALYTFSFKSAPIETAKKLDPGTIDWDGSRMVALDGDAKFAFFFSTAEPEEGYVNQISFYKGEAEDTTFKYANEFDTFMEVVQFLDKDTVDIDILAKNTDYTVAEGSTVLTLKADYLNTLDVGLHELGVLFDNEEGVARVLVNVIAKTNTDTNTGTDTNTNTNNPGTNDTVLWTAIGLIGAAALATAVIVKRRKEN